MYEPPSDGDLTIVDRTVTGQAITIGRDTTKSIWLVKRQIQSKEGTLSCANIHRTVICMTNTAIRSRGRGNSHHVRATKKHSHTVKVNNKLYYEDTFKIMSKRNPPGGYL